MSTLVQEGPAEPGAVARWVLAARPKTLTAAFAPVILGSALAAARGGIRVDALLSTALGAAFIQIGTNFANDYFDAKKGADGPDRLGPARATASGWIGADVMRRAMIIAFSLAVLAGVHLVWLRGWPIVVIGVTSVAAGVGYTAGRHAIAYVGLSELFVIAFFGIIATAGTFYAHTGAWSLAAASSGLLLGAIAAGILAVNNLRDRVGDARVNKNTLAVRFGERFARAEYQALIALAYGGVALLAVLEAQPGWLLPFLSAPLAWANLRSARRDDGRDLNALLGRTAMLELIFAMLAAVGVSL